MGRSSSFSRSRVSKGFALAEIMVALFLVTIAIVLVGGLGQQVMNLSRRSQQTGAVLELRSFFNSVTRNPTAWLNQMRSSTYTEGLYAGCIPDPKLNIDTFSCPSTSTDVIGSDDSLKEIAGTQYHAVSTSVVDGSGELIAGPYGTPVYLTNEGRRCQAQDTHACPLQST